MQNKRRIYIVPGYGVPKDIFTDVNMGIYLRLVANYIYRESLKKDSPPTVIFSGGSTDMWKPYQRTEAAEMWRWMKQGIRSKLFRKHLATWKVQLERRSLSTLENALLSRKYISTGDAVTVFSEYTRVPRWRALLRATKVSGAKTIGIDFDTSDNRYVEASIAEKEKKMKLFDLWALKNQQNFRQHHAFFQKRITYLRKAGPENHVQAIQQWWKIGQTFLPPEIRKMFT